MQTFKTILVIVLVVVISLSLAFGTEWLGIGWKGFFGPKHEAVRREVYEQSLSYNRGKAQELARYHLQYQTATPENKNIIANTIRIEFAEYDETLIDSPSLRNFLTQIKNGN